MGGEDRIFCFDNVSFGFVISIYSIHITIELATCISYIRTRNKGIEAEAIHHRFVSLTVSKLQVGEYFYTSLYFYSRHRVSVVNRE